MKLGYKVTTLYIDYFDPDRNFDDEPVRHFQMDLPAHLAGLGGPTHPESGMIDYGILGAGPAGLSMAMFLDGTSEVLEAGDHPGGHAASFFEEGFTFDYGPHIMFSKNKPVLQFMIDSLEGNVHECRRKNVVSFRNRLVKYPFENALGALPPEDNFACLKGYVYNPYKERYPKPANLREWLLATFGDGICERYLFPYNEKVWNIPVEDLSMMWADRIPNPNPDDILKSALGFETEGYLHQLYYHYPRRGGYQAISEAWAKRVPVNYGCRVQSLERRDDSWVVSDGRRTWEYRQLVSTLPIQQLAIITNLDIPAEVKAAIDGLIVNPMFIISLGIRGTDADQFTAIYFPEAEFLVNRVSFPATFSPDNAPVGTYSIQAEITCRSGSATWAMADDAILEHTIDGLVSPRSHPKPRCRHVSQRPTQNLLLCGLRPALRGKRAHCPRVVPAPGPASRGTIWFCRVRQRRWHSHSQSGNRQSVERACSGHRSVRGRRRQPVEYHSHGIHPTFENIFVSGGAGFIGSHLTRKLLSHSTVKRVVIFDNFSSGRESYLAGLVDDPRLVVTRGDLKELPAVTAAMEHCDTVFHLAANPDIAKAVTQPDIDFWEGTYLAQNVLEAMRVNGVRRILYTSGSGVYGENAAVAFPESYGPCLPISTYGASKLACEALISAYCHMFDMEGRGFRFANVVGPRQTHGVGYDFVRRLRADPTRLRILGDGTQSKSYIHVEDVLAAIFTAAEKSPARFDVFNVATDDYVTVREIADLAVQVSSLRAEDVRYEFTGGDRGWKGDVPVVRFDVTKIKSLGWRASRTATQALRDSIVAMRAGD